jgi:NTP pyrophosphatase (non-canonical NTP hydrolase)
MEFNTYQDFTATTAIYKEKCKGFESQVSYLALGLTGESGEVAEKIKKFLRDGTYVPTDIALELGDVLYYIAQLSALIGFSLEDVATSNKEKLTRRMIQNKLQGSGDHR